MTRDARFRQEDIVEAAFNIVRRSGWEELSARAIAEELGSSTMPIYSTLKSMKNLEEEVIRKGFSLMREYMHAERTGDQWLDFGLGYILFARSERNLFKSIHTERYVHLHEKYCDPRYRQNYETLTRYPPFEGLAEEDVQWIIYSRYAFAYGIASLMNIGLLDISKDEITEYLRDMQKVLLKGLKGNAGGKPKSAYKYLSSLTKGKYCSEVGQ